MGVATVSVGSSAKMGKSRASIVKIDEPTTSVISNNVEDMAVS
jgi:hypothetical protein